MRTSWFPSLGWFARRVSLRGGWLATLLALAFCVNVSWAVDRHSHSVSDTLYGVIPYFACTFLLWDWLARRSAADGGLR